MKNKILITGSNGLLGNYLKKNLRKQKLILHTSKHCDFTNEIKTRNYFKKNNPDIVIHTANKVFGITGNKKNSYSLLNDNITINTNILNAIKNTKVKKIIFISTSAIYSEKYTNNIKEKNSMIGMPHQSELYYGLAKRIFFFQLKTLKKNFDIDFTYVILNNIYGKFDNFNIDTGHVIPALIHKFYLARQKNLDLFMIGKKNDKRCFMHANDAAIAIIKTIKRKIEIINVSSKKEYSINELTKYLKEIYKFKKSIKWKSSNFKSPTRRNLNVDILKKINFKEKIPLDKGLRDTVNWFVRNYKNSNIRK